MVTTPYRLSPITTAALLQAAMVLVEVDLTLIVLAEVTLAVVAPAAILTVTP